jgi:hypothetical protein
MANGAMNKSPSQAAQQPAQGQDYNQLRNQYRGLAGKSDARSQQQRRELMKQMQAAKRQTNQPQGQTQQSPYESVQPGVAQGINQYLGYMQQQGQFQPGSFQDQMNQAYGNVMQQFEQTTAPQFQREQGEFAQMAAERGLDPNSEAYKSLQGQLAQRQDLARQQAMNQASQQAYGVQEQGFNQAAQQYQMPAQMLGQLGGYYGEMGAGARLGQQQQFEAGQSALDRAQRIKELQMQIAGQRRGGGGLSFEQQRQLQQEAIAGQMAANMAAGGSQQQRQPTWYETAAGAFMGQVPNAIMGR